MRFLYIAPHRPLFRDEVLSELMPPLEPDGTSLLWESLGRKFTGLSYQEADRLSQRTRSSSARCFPRIRIYATLLPPHVQELIGQVGPDTKGVEKMLREIGLRVRPAASIRSTAARTFTRRTDEITLVRAHAARARSPAGGDPTPTAAARTVAGRARATASAPRFLAVRGRGALAGHPRAGRGASAGGRWSRCALAATSGDAVAGCRPGRRGRPVPASAVRRRDAMPSTVFIVDDEKNIRRTVRMVLEGEGFAVEEASSGEEALARLPEVGADVMLLDVQLPGISGLETHRAHRPS